MSTNDRRAVKAIILLGAIAGEGHFGIYRTEVMYYIDKLSDLYYPKEGCGTQNEYAELKAEILKANNELCKVGKSTITMLMNSIMAIADDFARHCNGERGKYWNQFIEYAKDNELLINSAKNPEIQCEMVDKGIEVAEIIYN